MLFWLVFPHTVGFGVGMHKIKTALVVLITLACGLMLTACGEKKPENLLTVALSAEYPPFEFKQNNELVGYDVDLAKLLAEQLQRPLEIKNIEFSAIIPAVTSGRVDMAISGISATLQRAEVVDFSNTYYESRFAIVSTKEKPIHRLTELVGAKIGAQLGSTMEHYVKTHLDPALKNQVVTMGNNLPMIEELKVGRLNGVVVEDAQAYQFVKNNPELTYALLDPTGVGYAIALPKNSPLTAEVNTALKKLKMNRDLKALDNKWLETDKSKK